MAPGQKPGPSKWDGSLLSFFSSQTANANPLFSNALRTHPPHLWTWSPPASHEVAAEPTPAALHSYAAAAATNPSTATSSMDVDKPAASTAKHSATPPQSNQSSTKVPPTATPLQTIPRSKPQLLPPSPRCYSLPTCSKPVCIHSIPSQLLSSCSSCCWRSCNCHPCYQD